MTRPAQTVIAVNGEIVSGAPSTPRPIGGPVTVNGEVVLPAAIRAETQHHKAPKGKPGIAWRRAGNAVVVRTLLLQEARRRGLTPEPGEIGPRRFETDEEALIRALLEAEIVIETPDETSVRAEWERDPSRFRTPPLWEVSHILVACDARDEASRTAAQVRATELTNQVLSDPSAFSHLAREHSACASSASGGALGQIRPGDSVPEFEAALRSLTDGEIGREPVLTRHGWHVIRLDAVAEGDVLPFEAVRHKISDAMMKAAWSRAARRFVDRLVRSADLVGADLRPG